MNEQLRDSVNVRIEREQWKRLKQIAAEEERTVQAVTTRVLREAFIIGLRGTDP